MWEVYNDSLEVYCGEYQREYESVGLKVVACITVCGVSNESVESIR